MGAVEAGGARSLTVRITLCRSPGKEQHSRCFLPPPDRSPGRGTALENKLTALYTNLQRKLRLATLVQNKD